MSEWTEEMPAEPGIYELKCTENGHKPERVPVRSRERLLWALLDGLWNPLTHYHNNLTDCRWRLEERELVVRDLGEVDTEELVEELALRLRLCGGIGGKLYPEVRGHLDAFSAGLHGHPPSPRLTPAVIKPRKISLKKRPPGNQPMEPEDKT